MNCPLFSVIIPTYNRAEELQRCLSSLVNQTYKNFEVIVIDDGSTDHTSNIVQEFYQLLNLKYFFTENSGGPANGRNLGINESKGIWICFLDSDDAYLEDRLMNLSLLNLDGLDFLYHDLNVYKNSKFYYRMSSRGLVDNTYYDLLFNLNAIPTSSTCIRREVLKDEFVFSLNSRIIGLEDFHLWIRLANNKVKFKYIPMVMGNYFLGSDSLTLCDFRQVDRFKFLYYEFAKREINLNNVRKIYSALQYQKLWIISNSRLESSKYFLYLKYCFTFGSLAIKLRSIKLFFRFYFKS